MSQTMLRWPRQARDCARTSRAMGTGALFRSMASTWVAVGTAAAATVDAWAGGVGIVIMR
jgi:hypothetical protein